MGRMLTKLTRPTQKPAPTLEPSPFHVSSIAYRSVTTLHQVEHSNDRIPEDPLLFNTMSWPFFSRNTEQKPADISPPRPPPDPFGLTVLVEPTITGDGESIPVTNVIFVHGLGGSAKGTWTHENEFWPEWLPGTKGLENARIMAFGYDADWNKIWRPNNLLDISDFGDQLLNYLLLHYSNCGDAPTVFLAHSMGGLVVKEAMIKAHNVERFKRVLNNTIGILFLATPHRGSNLARTLANILKATFSERRFVGDLQLGSQTVDKINELFAERADGMALISFWESTDTRFVGTVVEKYSATLGYKDEVRVSLNGDHSSIVKYKSKEDSNYCLVSNHLALMVHEAAKKASTQLESMAIPRTNPSLNDAIHSTVVATSAFCVLYDRNPHFTGRDPLLERLHLALHDTRPKQYNHRISLHGLGGVGKTQIALEYAYRHKSHYQYVFWISAVDQAKLLSGFGSIAKATRCVNLTSIQQPDEAAKSVLKWLEITEKCLLVIDNLDDFAIVDGYLPSTTSAVHTLITTRNKFSNRIPAEGFEIMTMGPEESVEFLTQRIKLPNSQSSQVLSEAPKIVKELGYLPLAMEQAAAYICESENIVEFLTTFKESRRELLARRTAGNSYPYTIATTWRMSLKGLESLCPNSIVLLQFLVFLNPDEILVEFLKAGASGLKSELRAIIADNFRFRECLIALQSFSLIRVFGGAEKIGIHRLVQGVIKDDLNAQQQAGLLSNAVQLGLQSFPSMSDLSKRETCRRYLSQVIPFLGGNNRITDSKWQILVDRIAHYLHEDGFYFDCFRWSRLLFETRSSVLGLEHPGMLRSMQNLAASYRSLGQFKESAQLDGETLDIQKRVLGSEHPDTLRTMNGLASSYWSLGQFREAARLYGETLDIQKRVLGSEHPGTLRSINGLASSYWSLGQVREAAQLNGETLDIQKRVLGSEHPDTLRNMNSLASSYWSLGQFREAARLYGETLDIQNRVLGSEHPDTLRTMNGLAVSYRDVGQVKEAARLHKETVEIQKRVLGSEPPNTIRSMKNLELLYREHGLNEEEG